jgi:hypothetical protein
VRVPLPLPLPLPQRCAHSGVGKAFVSTMEAKAWPIYGVQWHPETIAFLFTPSDAIPHSSASIFAMQSVARFFVDEARLNAHRFTDAKALQDLLIYNYCPSNRGYGAANYFFGANTPTPANDEAGAA